MAWWKKFLREWWFTLAIVAVIGGGLLFLSTQPSPLQTWADLEEQLASGQPVIVEVYSNA